MSENSANKPWSKPLLLLTLFIVVAGVGFRMAAMKKSFWLDELHTTELGHQPLTAMIQLLGADFHAPLYFLSVNVMDTLGMYGHSLRWGAFVFGLLGIIPLVALLREMGIGSKGLVATLAVFFLAPFQIRYGVELRPYSLLQTLCLVLLWAAFSESKSGRFRFLVFAAATAAGLYVHYLSSVFVVAIGTIRLFAPGSKTRLKWPLVVLAGTCGVLLFLPWVLAMESWLVDDPEAIVRSDQVSAKEAMDMPEPKGFGELKGEIVEIIPRTLVPGSESLGKNSSRFVLVGLGLVGAVLTLGLAHLVRRRKCFGPVFGLILVGVLAAGLVTFLCVVFWHRIPIQYFAVAAWIWPVLSGLVVDGIERKVRKNLALVLLLLGLSLAAIGETTGMPREQLQEASKRAQALAIGMNAHLTAVMRQPDHYDQIEVFRVYGGAFNSIPPDEVPRSDGRPVIVLTRRTDLASPDLKKSYARSLLSERKITQRMEAGRGLCIYLLESQ